MKRRSLYSEYHNVPGPDEIRSGLWISSVGHYRARDHVQMPRLREDFLLVYCLSGSGNYRVGEASYRIGGGDVFVCFPGVLHQYESDKQQGWDIRWVHFDGNRATELLGMVGFHLSQLVHQIGQKKELEEKLRTMQRLLSRHDEDGTLEASGVLYQLLLGLRSQTRSRSLREHGIEQALRGEPVSVSAMAAACGLSRSHFTRKFRKSTGISPWRYIMNRRIARAKDLLSNTELSIKEIAVQLGFEDPNYFSRLFHEEVGSSPTAFREMRVQRG